VHNRDQILQAAVEVVCEVGLAEMTYRRVGTHLGIADRTVVYYFPTKVQLVLAVLDVVAEKVGDAMSGMLEERDLTVTQAMTGIFRSLANDELDPYFRIYIELVGLAVARKSPYDQLPPRIYQYWIDWLEPRMAGPAHHRRAAAIAAFAQADGLLLAHHQGHPEAAELGARYFITDPA
jgi:AcrR family transcriptional regulator